MVVALSMLASLALLPAVPAFGQEVPGGEALGIFVDIFYVVFFVFYIYSSWATQIIARKTNTENGWLAWIPIANLVLWAHMANKPVWWGILCLVPLVGLVFTLLLWMTIAEARHKPKWWGILMIIPVVQFIVPGYLAWSN
jgi:hypothetical protein